MNTARNAVYELRFSFHGKRSGQHYMGTFSVLCRAATPTDAVKRTREHVNRVRSVVDRGDDVEIDLDAILELKTINTPILIAYAEHDSSDFPHSYIDFTPERGRGREIKRHEWASDIPGHNDGSEDLCVEAPDPLVQEARKAAKLRPAPRSGR